MFQKLVSLNTTTKIISPILREPSEYRQLLSRVKIFCSAINLNCGEASWGITLSDSLNSDRIHYEISEELIVVQRLYDDASSGRYVQINYYRNLHALSVYYDLLSLVIAQLEDSDLSDHPVFQFMIDQLRKAPPVKMKISGRGDPCITVFERKPNGLVAQHYCIVKIGMTGLFRKTYRNGWDALNKPSGMVDHSYLLNPSQAELEAWQKLLDSAVEECV